MNFRYKLIQFLSGRYGIDETFFLIIGVSASLAIVNIFVRSIILQLIVYSLSFLAILRSFSRNFEARQKENAGVRRIYNTIRRNTELQRKRRMDYSHIYKKCPRCKAILRLPRRKGKHTTVCPKCNNKFKVRVFK